MPLAQTLLSAAYASPPWSEQPGAHTPMEDKYTAACALLLITSPSAPMHGGFPLPRKPTTTTEAIRVVAPKNQSDNLPRPTRGRVIQKMQNSRHRPQLRQLRDSNCDALNENLNKPAVLCDAINRIQTLRAKLATVDGQYRTNLIMMGKKRKIDRIQGQVRTNQNGMWVNEAMRYAGFSVERMNNPKPEPEQPAVDGGPESSSGTSSPRGQMAGGLIHLVRKSTPRGAELNGSRGIQRMQKNHRERQRRQSINTKYEELTRVLGINGLNKAKILSEAINRIQMLRRRFANEDGQIRGPKPQDTKIEGGSNGGDNNPSQVSLHGETRLGLQCGDPDDRKVRKNSREKRRRLSINIRYQILTELLVPRPDLVKWNKAHCLARAITEITTLQNKLKLRAAAS